MALAGNPQIVAGLNFRIAEAYLATGDHQDAGKRFRMASETTDFPAADYAAGLAGCSFYCVPKRRDSADELLVKALDVFPASPLQED